MLADIQELKQLDNLKNAYELNIMDLSAPLADKPVDHFNKLSTKTDIYLDISDFHSTNALSSFGVFLGGFICVASLPLIVHFFSQVKMQHALLYPTIGGIVLMMISILSTNFLSPAFPIMRLNRQRREIYTRRNWTYACAPWDQVIIIRAYRRVKTGKSSLRNFSYLYFYVKNPTTDTYQILAEILGNEVDDNTEQKINEFLECLRLFMDCSADACPNSTQNCTTPEDGLDITAIHSNWRKYKKYPTFINPEILEWSKPISTPTNTANPSQTD